MLLCLKRYSGLLCCLKEGVWLPRGTSFLCCVELKNPIEISPNCHLGTQMLKWVETTVSQTFDEG